LLVGLVGDDVAARDLRVSLARMGVSAEYLVSDKKRPTTVKTRVVAHAQHVVRVDDEDASPVDASLGGRIINHLLSLIPKVDLVIVSDYSKGLLTKEVLKAVMIAAGECGRPVVVDPKGNDYSRYEGAALVCPNRLEAVGAGGLDPSTDMHVVGEHLLSKLALDAVLITLGESGMLLFEDNQQPVHIPAVARTVYDVTGAGDTVMGSIGLALAAGAELLAAAWLANIAAGIAVEHVGTTAVTSAQLRRTLRDRVFTPTAMVTELS
jgi:D-beta-D-heptose 7-phosphate kinase/D-beta-D-heptose 1-phosphate adenosyltransferase